MIKIKKSLTIKIINLFILITFLWLNPAYSLRVPMDKSRNRLREIQRQLLLEKHNIIFLREQDALAYLDDEKVLSVPSLYTDNPIDKAHALRLITNGEAYLAKNYDGKIVLVSISTDTLAALGKYDMGEDNWAEINIGNSKRVVLYQEGNIYTKQNYYVDLLCRNISNIVERLKKEGNALQNILEIGTGRGTISIGFAKATPETTHIVAVDKNEEAVKRVSENARLNSVEGKIETRIGDLSTIVKTGEKFDLIVFDLPLIPRDRDKFPDEYLERYPYLKAMFGGEDGRYFIDYMIRRAGEFLNENGAIIFTQPDFTRLDWTSRRLIENGFEPWDKEQKTCVIGMEYRQLKPGSLTWQLREYIEKKLEFIFPIVGDNELGINACVVGGIKRNSHDEDALSIKINARKSNNNWL